ncbi:MAG TPA: STAS domain-containing protein [Iamia sp.]|nr:STAS domain-containing protein [Iamia sp.]
MDLAPTAAGRRIRSGIEIRATGLVIGVLSADGTALLRLDGDLDSASAPALLDVGRSLVAAGSQHLVIDCGHLRFCDSAGLHAFASIGAADGARSLALARTSPRLRRMLDMAGLDVAIDPQPTG